ncbi:hypothetical protein VN12_12340 [Pirellula sp. SH-Sr6A]|nr:hypothetical protein VN12_12340 [Pirellula sp. SH-Sr6A]
MASISPPISNTAKGSKPRGNRTQPRGVNPETIRQKNPAIIAGFFSVLSQQHDLQIELGWRSGTCGRCIAPATFWTAP